MDRFRRACCIASLAEARPFISERQVLTAILRDLQATPERERPFVRYFSFANVWNARIFFEATDGLSGGAEQDGPSFVVGTKHHATQTAWAGKHCASD
jgi:hypothetical protein